MAKNTIKIKSNDFWIKTLDMLLQNWALIEKDYWSEASKVFFINDLSEVIDLLHFPTEAEAKSALKINGFWRYAEDEEAQKIIVAPSPPYCLGEHSFSEIYSSGRYWRNPPESPQNYTRYEVLSIEMSSRKEWVQLIKAMESTLKNKFKVDVVAEIEALGQVELAKSRENGKAFTFSEHLRGLVLSLLSSVQDWSRIEKNMDYINGIFKGFDAESLLHEYSSDKIMEQLKQRSLAGLTTRKQMKELPSIIRKMESIASEYGSLDTFVNRKPACQVAAALSDEPYKLNQIGFALASEYLKNVGIATVKPDRHIMDITGKERLDFDEWANGPSAISQKLNDIAERNDICPTWLDNLFWLFGKHCCKKQPLCNQCEVKSLFFCKVIPMDFDAKAVEILKIERNGCLPFYESQSTLYRLTHNDQKHYVLTITTIDTPELYALTEKELRSMGRMEFKRIDTITGNKIEDIIHSQLPAVDVAHDERFRCDGGSRKVLIGTRCYDWRSGLVPPEWWLLDEIVNRLNSY